jgi:RNA polymerase sigma-70 factor, ECF subfamily
MVESFETYRSYLFAIAYRMLGSAMDAEDMVQETYLRYSATPPETIISLKAFLILLEQLQPIERAVFLLREVFEYDYVEIAAFLGKSEVACRQSFSRAKKHLADHQPRFPASPETQKQLLTGFLQAVNAGEMSALMNLLAEDVTFWGDGGGKVKGAATHPISGRVAVARFFLATGNTFRRSLPEDFRVELAEVNHQPALIIRSAERAFSVMTIEVEAGRIQIIRVVANAEKLAHV